MGERKSRAIINKTQIYKKNIISWNEKYFQISYWVVGNINKPQNFIFYFSQTPEFVSFNRIDSPTPSIKLEAI